MKVEIDFGRIKTFEGTLEEFEKVLKILDSRRKQLKEPKPEGKGMMDKFNKVLDSISK